MSRDVDEVERRTLSSGHWVVTSWVTKGVSSLSFPSGGRSGASYYPHPL